MPEYDESLLPGPDEISANYIYHPERKLSIVETFRAATGEGRFYVAFRKKGPPVGGVADDNESYNIPIQAGKVTTAIEEVTDDSANVYALTRKKAGFFFKRQVLECRWWHLRRYDTGWGVTEADGTVSDQDLLIELSEVQWVKVLTPGPRLAFSDMVMDIAAKMTPRQQADFTGPGDMLHAIDRFERDQGNIR